MRGVAAIVCALGMLGAGGTAAEDIFLDLTRAVPSFRVEEFQPDIKWSGRINTIAVHPTDPDRLTVASETGGLFQSDDRGETWRHLDGLPVARTVSVAYYWHDPQRLVATSRADFKTTSGAGIWESNDGGATWAKASIRNTPSNGDCTASTEAWGISAIPRGMILVATDCGIAVTDTTGNWTRRTDGNAGLTFHSVLQLDGQNQLAAGPRGVYYTSDGGRNWTRATGRMGSVSSYHALAVSPLDARRTYLIEDERPVLGSDEDRRNAIYYSFDRGRSWLRGTDPGRGAAGCGGIPFVKAAARGSRTQLFAGNRCDVFRSAGGGWAARMETDHPDTRDLLLMGDEPTYLATDGGFHAWDGDAGSWVAKGGARAGLSALQVYEVTGQQIEGSILGWPFVTEPRRYDLYIGTQDNWLWSSSNGGRDWRHSRGAEGFRIDLTRSVRTAADSRVVYTACGDCVTKKSGANFRAEVEFPDATPHPSKAYGMLAEGAFAQYGSYGIGEDPLSALFFTEDFGREWVVADVFPEAAASLPQFSGSPSVAYFSVRTGADAQGRPVDALRRTVGFRDASPACEGDASSSAFGCYPAMAGHRGLGRRDHTSGFATESVFAVDPADPMHLIAPDPRDNDVKESWDGGDSWRPIEGVRALVSRDGALTSVVNPLDNWSSLISAVSFHPENATLVLMGAREGGIYFSHDRGRRWQHVPGSERVTNVSSFHWKSHNEVYVSSYGRGLWRLSIAWAAPPESFAVACGDRCLLADVTRPDPVPFDGKVDFEGAVLTYGGGVMDARAESGLLKAVSVTPGTTWVLVSPSGNKLPSSAAGANAVALAKTEPEDPITEASEPGDFKGVEAAQALLKQGWLIRGFTLVEGRVKHVVVAKEEVVVKGPGSVVSFKNTGKAESDVLKRPYLTVEYEAVHGLLTVSGSRFSPARPVSVLLDGQPVKHRVHVRPDGRFSLHLRPRLGPGPHGLRAQQTEGGKVVVAESADFLVPSADAAEDTEEKDEEDEQE